MDYTEVSFKIEPLQPYAEILMAELEALGYDSFVEEADGIKAYIVSSQFDAAAIKALYLMQSADVTISFAHKALEDKNWNAEWESGYEAVDIDGRCYIRAPFHPAMPTYDYDIVISPKMSFGTAHHETTAQMIRLLLDEKLQGFSMLDMGSGTAVLAILAALKGASAVDAIDNDEWAYNNAVENISINGCSQIKAILGDASSIPATHTYDLILANIHKNILMRDMGIYVSHLKPEGKLFFSGFYASDLDDMKQAAQKHGLQYVEHLCKNNWVAAVFQKH